MTTRNTDRLYYLLPILYAVLAVIGLSGCVRDTIYDPYSAARFAFRYDKNAEGIDRFSDEVDFLDLLIYDHPAGTLHTRTGVSRTDLNIDQSILVTLLPGEYTAVVWGYGPTNPYRIEGADDIQTLRLTPEPLAGKDTVGSEAIGPLFHSADRLTVPGYGETEAEVSLTKNTNRITVRVSGPKDLEDALAEGNISVVLSGPHREYRFDNSASGELVYQSDYSIVGKDLAADFSVLRLRTADRETVRVRVKYSLISSNVQPITVVYDEPAIPLLRADNLCVDDFTDPDEADDFLERHDRFTIDLTITIDAEGNVQIDGWDRIHKPGEL